MTEQSLTPRQERSVAEHDDRELRRWALAQVLPTTCDAAQACSQAAILIKFVKDGAVSMEGQA